MPTGAPMVKLIFRLLSSRGYKIQHPGLCLNQFNSHGNHKKITTPKGVVIFMVEAGGVEPPSENASWGISPGAGGYLHSLAPA
jgi:hypothetical protein